MTKKTIEAMQDNIIRKYGFEADETIAFFRICENKEFREEEIIAIYKKLIYLY